MDQDLRSELGQYLQAARDALVWKLEGLTEYDRRRPATRTGTNLLGLVKHLTGVELLYLGWAFGRLPDRPPAWFTPDAEPGTDLWATADESSEQIVSAYCAAWAHGDATIAELGLDDTGEVEWWPEAHRRPTLHRVLVHLIAETARHAGHADIVRESLDGAVGQLDLGGDPVAAESSGDVSQHSGEEAYWSGRRELIERAAREAESAGR